MESIFVVFICLAAIIGGIWMTYDTYKNPIKNTIIPNEVYYIKGVGVFLIGLYILISYFTTLF